MNELFLKLARSSERDLERVFASADGPALSSIAGYEFRGFNVPWFTSLLGIRKFIKGFFQGEKSVEGYNIPARQNGLDGEWLHLPTAATPKRFGFYTVERVNPAAKDNLYPRAALLDYGASARNPKWRPERVLRDYLVQPDPTQPDVLLGKAYLALGAARVNSNFFVLNRLRATPWKP